MRNHVSKSYVTTTMLLLSMLLLACGRGDGSSHADLVAFDQLVANAQQYAGQYLCTEGVHVDGFEASGLAAAMFDKDGHPQLTEPVIWVEGADLQSREDCLRTATSPSFEFCQAVFCGVFEAGEGYGHGGAYAYQLRGGDVSTLPSPSVTPQPLSTVSPEDTAPGVSESGSEVLPMEPPPAVLEVADQVSAIGSYCWTQPTEEETASSLCADMEGTRTAVEPLIVSSPLSEGEYQAVVGSFTPVTAASKEGG
jgi:hypothetical protein